MQWQQLIRGSVLWKTLYFVPRKYLDPLGSGAKVKCSKYAKD